MSVNSAVQQAASGIANLTAGMLVTRETSGRLAGYPRAGWLAVGAFALTVVLAWRLRSAAPHAAKPGRAPSIVPVVTD
jgi:hypothetical protein